MKRRDSLKILTTLPLLASFPSLAMAAGKKDEKKKDNKGKAVGKAKAPGQMKKTGNLLDEKDTLASAMQYKHDASKVGAMRSDKTAFCNNCAKYNVCMDGDKDCKPLAKGKLAKADAAPCQIFKAKVVKGKGWCLSWQAL